MKAIKGQLSKDTTRTKKKRHRNPTIQEEEPVAATEPPRLSTLYPPLPPTHPGFFGGGSAFHTMTGGYPYGMGHFGPGLPGMMGGYYPPMGYAPMGGAPAVGGYGGYGMGGPMPRMGYEVPPQPLLGSSHKSLGKPKDYKEGGSAVKFDSFDGQKNKLKALTFIQQFDAAFSGGHFTESSKVRKAASFLKGMLFNGGPLCCSKE